MYKEGLAVQERRRVPVVGAAVDRRAFEKTLEVYNDDSIRSLICFVCARVCLHTGGAHSAINYRPGEWLLTLPTGTKKKQKDRFLNGRDCKEKSEAIPKSTNRFEGRAKKTERKKKANINEAV